MPVRLNNHLEAPKRSNPEPNVNPSLGAVGTLDTVNSRRHSGSPFHDHSSEVEPVTENDAEDADEDCGEDGDCETNSIKIS